MVCIRLVKLTVVRSVVRTLGSIGWLVCDQAIIMYSRPCTFDYHKLSRMKKKCFRSLSNNLTLFCRFVGLFVNLFI